MSKRVRVSGRVPVPAFDRPAQRSPGFRLSVSRCPMHSTISGRGDGKLTGFWSISLDDQHGGYRLTHSKCCGQWLTVLSFRADPRDLIESIAKEAGLEVEIKEKEKEKTT